MKSTVDSSYQLSYYNLCLSFTVVKVTSLSMDNQLLTHLTNLERMTNLRWASFNNNDIFRIEVRFISEILSIAQMLEYFEP